ncbi:hypothetical protein CC1G_05128 [Coprinopsis cinerea okayama7|uniref:Enhancer of mRNA-decapping protein 4 WD40 repeat region domain-containing protein n=1 Tax=Coprinopsis cinerea (strain Okayama-7 / 130 / ATCC MYA-4618 / FGSC 9003) TaxID=240176 RepID=A8NFY3_COPC7|nr:hypothetical protein CC1G_05128 [Coprinopsis cinerea okayama7\|eukprot:XP_001833428.2 hypothetical protein CC1G_05128 [Coprinopsis cinerea okayama7\
MSTVPMDNRLQELFSRASTPPQNQPNPTSAAPAAQQPPNNSSSDLIDSLFHHIMVPQDHQSQQSGSLDAPVAVPEPNTVVSAPISPALPLTDEPPTVSSSASAPGTSATTVQERQSALLSLLNQPSSSARLPPAQAAQAAQQPQQIPTPPGSSRSNASPSHTENQKILLEQLMGSAVPRSNVADNQRGPAPSAPSPPYNPPPPRDGEYRPYNQHDQSELSPRLQPVAPGPVVQPPPPSQPTPPAIQQQQQQQFSPPQQTQHVPLPPPQPQAMPQQLPNPPSPRRSMFEFMSPFDHLSSTTGSIKKKPVPTQSASASSTNDDSSWTHVTDPKRQSMENLLDTLTRGAPLQTQPVQAQNNQYEPYVHDHGYPIQPDPYNQARIPPPPLPPKIPVQGPPHRTSSPRGSPPKSQARAPQQQVVQAASNLNRRDKEGSPGPRSGNRSKNLNFHHTKTANKNQSSPVPQTQTILFDVAKINEDVQAPRDYVKSTAIALVRQESVFLPGSTIGATHWVAYAMTRGRVRVISRSSGDRTLLQLPNLFPSTTSVIDMAVYGNRLAGVTSDGGFVLWELPDLITDDVPGDLLLCIPPTNNPVDALRAVKWHPKEPGTLAIASDSKIYVIHLTDIANLQGPVPHGDLHHIGQMYGVPSMICAFDFDPLHYSLAAITEDSTLTMWNLQDTIPYATHKVRGEDIPSYLAFVDGGIVIGRRNGTIFQLLAHSTKSVLSTIKFINSQQEDPDMFGHANYDSRIQTLWIANSRRESIIACKLNIESSYVNGEEQVRGQFEQVVEFTGPKATIHFVILTGDSDPHGDEAHAACIAAKLPPGELALVAFSVHSSGVDQVLIRKEWFDSALMTAGARYPAIELPPPVARIPSPTDSSITATKPSRGPLPIPPTGAPSQVPINIPSAPNSGIFPPPRGRTPPTDQQEDDFNNRGEEARANEGKGKANKSKNVNWKEKDDGKDNHSAVGGGHKDKGAKSSDSTLITDPQLSQVLSKEMKKTEDSLHNRISRLISKEMDKQHQRLEDARAHEQAEDFARQEKILKLISTELTRNTTRVVEMAVKSEVQNSVLPSLENITKNEVKTALNEQVGRGLVDVINQSLPIEIEKLFTRPDISNHFAHVISANLTPLIERQVKDAVVKAFVPVFSQQASSLHQELIREVRGEINGLKSELNAWKNDALRGHESSLRDLELTVRSLSDQVKFLSMNPVNPPSSSHHHLQGPQPSQGSPAGSIQPGIGQQAHRQAPVSGPNPQPQPYSHPHPHQVYQPVPPPQPQPAPGPVHQPWFGIAAPQASHPATIPQPLPQPQPERTPPIKADQWDEIYLGVLHTQDVDKLRDLLGHTNPDLIMPLNGQPLVSQAVVLTLVHRLSSIVADSPPNDEWFKSALWWLQRAVAVLRPDDPLITDFIPRVVPNVRQLINTTKQRLTILPGGGPSTMETARTLSDIHETLRRKGGPGTSSL